MNRTMAIQNGMAYTHIGNQGRTVADARPGRTHSPDPPLNSRPSIPRLRRDVARTRISNFDANVE